MFKRMIPAVAALAMVVGGSAGLLAATEGPASATIMPKITVSVSYPTAGSSTEYVQVHGSGFTPGGNVWVGLNPMYGQAFGTGTNLLCNGVSLNNGNYSTNAWCSFPGGVNALAPWQLLSSQAYRVGTFDATFVLHNVVCNTYIEFGCNGIHGRVAAADQTTGIPTTQVMF